MKKTLAALALIACAAAHAQEGWYLAINQTDHTRVVFVSTELAKREGGVISYWTRFYRSTGGREKYSLIKMEVNCPGMTIRQLTSSDYDASGNTTYMLGLM